MKYKRKKGVSFKKGKKKTFPFRGVNYKSGLELKMAKLLYEANIKFQYEPTTFHLMEGFKFTTSSYERQTNGKGEFMDRGNKKILPIKYTPDFIGDNFVIETKGHANESFPLRWKMFKDYMMKNDVDVLLFKPQSHKECEQVIQILKTIPKNGNTTAKRK